MSCNLAFLRWRVDTWNFSRLFFAVEPFSCERELRQQTDLASCKFERHILKTREELWACLKWSNKKIWCGKFLCVYEMMMMSQWKFYSRQLSELRAAKSLECFLNSSALLTLQKHFCSTRHFSWLSLLKQPCLSVPQRSLQLFKVVLMGEGNAREFLQHDTQQRWWWSKKETVEWEWARVL